MIALPIAPTLRRKRGKVSVGRAARARRLVHGSNVNEGARGAPYALYKVER